MSIAFSTAAVEEIDAIVDRYPERMAALIPVLYVAQREFGAVSQEVLKLVAAQLQVPEAKVLSTATFYTMFYKEPVGEYHVQICWNLSCFLRGCDALMGVLKDELGLTPGDVASDRRFSLEGVECLAACGTAPIVRINETYHENVTPEGLRSLLGDLGSGAEAAG